MDRLPKVQVICPESGKSILIDASDIRNKTSEQIIDQLKKKSFITGDVKLSLISRNGPSIIFDDASIPLHVFPELAFIPNVLPKEIPYHLYLSVSEKYEKTVSSIQFPMIVVDNESKILYRINLMFLYPITLEKVLIHLSHIHAQGINRFEFYNTNGEKFTSTDEREVNRALFFGVLYVVFSPSRKCAKQMRLRVNAVESIVFSEDEYVHSMDGFVDNVGAFLRSNAVLPDEIIDPLLDRAKIIGEIHSTIRAEMHRTPPDFMTCIGSLFKKNYPNIEVYEEYLKLYKQITEKVLEAMRNPALKDAIAEFQESVFSAGTRFDGILLLPVSRCTKYVRLLRELLHRTGRYHPDYRSLVEVYAAFKSALREIEGAVSHLEGVQRIIAFNQYFLPSVDIALPGRELIGVFSAQDTRPYKLLVFSDEFWTTLERTQFDGRRRFVVLDQHAYADAIVLPYGDHSVFIRTKDEDRVVAMEDARGRDVFMRVFHEAALKRAEANGSRVVIRIEQVDIPRLPKLFMHCLCVDDSYLWLYGGLNKRDEAQGNLRCLPHGETTLLCRKFDATKDPPRRYNAAMCATGGSLFLYGGTADSETILRDFWRFDIDESEWHEIETEGERPPPGRGCTLSASHDGLLLFCGTGSFGVWRYDIASNRWERLELTNNIESSSLSNFGLVPVDDDTSLVIGGITHGGVYNNSTLILNLRERVLTSGKVAGSGPLNSIGQVAGRLGASEKSSGAVIVLGSKDDPRPLALDIDEQRWVVPSLVGDRFEAEYAASTVFQDTMYIHGGIDELGHAHSELYTVRCVVKGEAAKPQFVEKSNQIGTIPVDSAPIKSDESTPKEETKPKKEKEVKFAKVETKPERRALFREDSFFHSMLNSPRKMREPQWKTQE